jgi:uncharacterized membrane protein
VGAAAAAAACPNDRGAVLAEGAEVALTPKLNPVDAVETVVVGADEPKENPVEVPNAGADVVGAVDPKKEVAEEAG